MHECTKCRNEKALADFPIKVHNNPSGKDQSKKCTSCIENDKSCDKKKREADKENNPTSAPIT